MRKNVTCDLVRMPGAVCTELAEVANEQYGFLTPEDARDLDIDPITLSVRPSGASGATRNGRVSDAADATEPAGWLYGGDVVARAWGAWRVVWRDGARALRAERRQSSEDRCHRSGRIGFVARSLRPPGFITRICHRVMSRRSRDTNRHSRAGDTASSRRTLAQRWWVRRSTRGRNGRRTRREAAEVRRELGVKRGTSVRR